MPKTIDTHMMRRHHVMLVAQYHENHSPEQILDALKSAAEIINELSKRLSIARDAANLDNTLEEVARYAAE